MARQPSKVHKLACLLDPTIPEPELLPGYEKRMRGRYFKLETALRALEGVLDRAAAINRQKKPPYLIDRIDLFGSVLRAKPIVGDLDLHVKVGLKDGWTWDRARAWATELQVGSVGFLNLYDYQLAAL